MADSRYDAVVVGSGPNGLAAAITLAEQQLKVLLIEARDTVGGGCRSSELTLPGFTHDICSAFHPLGLGSPFFERLPLGQHGLKWIHPAHPLAHPLDDGKVVLLRRSLEETADALNADGPSYTRLMKPIVEAWPDLRHELLQPLRWPKHPIKLGQIGLKAMLPAVTLAKKSFKETPARAMFAGLAAHSFVPLTSPFTSAIGLMLGVLGHTVGWPIPEGGSQRLSDALASYFRSLNGEILLSTPIKSIDELPAARAVLLDLTPRQVLALCGGALSSGYRRRLSRFRYGPSAFKIDYALDGPVPWTAEECATAGTVHLGGTLEEIAEAERQTCDGQASRKPFVLAGQQSLFDSKRSPKGQQTFWVYGHAPHGFAGDLTGAIEKQIERFASGFSKRILKRSVMKAHDLEVYNANYIGGDISGGANSLDQLFARPIASFHPYATSKKGLYICSASTPPGAGVHGMCGYHAAQLALRQDF